MPLPSLPNATDPLFLQKGDHVIRGQQMGLPMLNFVAFSLRASARPIKWHHHDGHEILLLQRGSTGYEFRGGREVQLAGDQFMIVPARMTHRGLGDVRMPSCLCAILFVSDGTGSKASPFTKAELRWIDEQCTRHRPAAYNMSASLRRMVQSLQQALKQNASEKAAQDAVAALRLLLASIILEAVRDASGNRNTGTADRMALVTAHMEQHYHEPLQMSDIASVAGCSRAWLFALFKESIGMSPNDWLQRLRIKKAGELLAQTNRKLEDIAQATGFSSSQYFCQVFRKYTGTNPSSHRSRV